MRTNPGLFRSAKNRSDRQQSRVHLPLTHPDGLKVHRRSRERVPVSWKIRD